MHDKTVADLFAGQWLDASNRILYIRVLTTETFAVDFLGPGGFPFSRSLLNGQFPSLGMPALLETGRLIVELGSPGLGPTMSLVYSDDPFPHLLPDVWMGLYDDWEDDFGMPWVFPLSVFRRQARKRS